MKPKSDKGKSVDVVVIQDTDIEDSSIEVFVDENSVLSGGEINSTFQQCVDKFGRPIEIYPAVYRVDKPYNGLAVFLTNSFQMMFCFVDDSLVCMLYSKRDFDNDANKLGVFSFEEYNAILKKHVKKGLWGNNLDTKGESSIGDTVTTAENRGDGLFSIFTWSKAEYKPRSLLIYRDNGHVKLNEYLQEYQKDQLQKTVDEL